MGGIPMISIVMPIYCPSERHEQMARKAIYLAKENTDLNAQWVIVETGSQHFIDEADIYIYERERTNPNNSVNRGFKAADGDYVVFISTDTFVSEDWLESLIDCFEKEDCGIASLGNSEHKDEIKDEIVEGLFFSVCMMKKEDAWFDPFYTFVFDDTDLIFRLYTQGKKFYKNLNSFVEHTPHSTLGHVGGDIDMYRTAQAYFIDKYWDYRKDNFFVRLSNFHNAKIDRDLD